MRTCVDHNYSNIDIILDIYCVAFAETRLINQYWSSINGTKPLSSQ